MAEFSPYWESKIRHYFSILDTDKDGKLTENDFQLLGDRYIEYTQVDDRRAKKVRAKIAKFWPDLQKASLDGPMTVDVFVQYIKEKGINKLDQRVTEIYLVYFDLFDPSGDGTISLEEFKVFQKVHGVDPVHAEETFRALDTDNDGKLTEEEFVDAARTYFTALEECEPVKNLYGPLQQP
jgi:hypothetical protein